MHKGNVVFWVAFFNIKRFFIFTLQETTFGGDAIFEEQKNPFKGPMSPLFWGPTGSPFWVQFVPHLAIGAPIFRHPPTACV